MNRHSSHHPLGLGVLALISATMLTCSAQAQSPAKPAGAKEKAPASASSTGASTDSENGAIKKALEDKFPGATIGGIVKSPYAGLFEVQFDDQLVYTDAKVSYVFVGSVYDASSKRNLTEEKMRKLTRVSWDSLPLDLAMKKVKGTGQRKIAVFADADCPFCAKLESELKNVDNVTIYTFVYPIDQLHPDAARKTRIIWCAPDRVAAWDAWFANKTLPDNKGDCETPLDKTVELGQKLKINATPTLIFADGSMIPGALPAQRLESEIKQGEAEAAKLADSAKAAQKPAARAAKPTAVN
jgi:thiol:disulfide interchange protein DsbC